MAPTSEGDQPEFFFLTYEPQGSRKDRALQERQRRAHAARRSHAFARRSRRPAITSKCPPDDPPSSASHLISNSSPSSAIVPSPKPKAQHHKYSKPRWHHGAPEIQTPNTELILGPNRLDPFNSF